MAVKIGYQVISYSSTRNITSIGGTNCSYLSFFCSFFDFPASLVSIDFEFAVVSFFTHILWIS